MAYRMIRFDADLFDAALEEGRRENRSVRQQLEHWTRIGQMFSGYETSTRRRIAGAVRGEIPLASLSSDERLIANMELDVTARARAAALPFGHVRLESGLTAVAIDEEGALIEFDPGAARRRLDHEGDAGPVP